MRCFSHPDCTVGFGIAPNQPKWLADLGQMLPVTAGYELHNTLKRESSYSLFLVYHVYACLSSVQIVFAKIQSRKVSCQF